MASKLRSVSKLRAVRHHRPVLLKHIPPLPPLVLFSVGFSYSTYRPNSSSSGPETTGPSAHKYRFFKLFTLPYISQIMSAIGGGLVVFGGNVLFLRYQHEFIANSKEEVKLENKRAALRSLEEGSGICDFVKNVIPRRELANQIRPTLTPRASPVGYSMIVGEHGTGKTSLIHLILNGFQSPRGTIFVDCSSVTSPDTKEFFTMFKEAIGYKNIGDEIDADFVSLLNCFKDAAIQYKEIHGKIPVLILDNVNRLTEYQPALLDALQDRAKTASDYGQYTVVFVSSEGNVPARMKSRSAWSRLQGIQRIGDVTRDEAFEYLNLFGLGKEECEKVYDLVGGRMIDLRTAATQLEVGLPYEAFRAYIIRTAAEEFERVGIFHNQSSPESKMGAEILKLLLKKGHVSLYDYKRLVKNDQVAERLLSGNLLALDIETRTVTFQSTKMKNYCREHPEVWGGDDDQKPI